MIDIMLAVSHYGYIRCYRCVDSYNQKEGCFCRDMAEEESSVEESVYFNPPPLPPIENWKLLKTVILFLTLFSSTSNSTFPSPVDLLRN